MEDGKVEEKALENSVIKPSNELNEQNRKGNKQELCKNLTTLGKEEII